MFFGFFFCLTIAINKHVRIQKIFPGWGGGFARLFELYREGGGVWGIFLKNLNKRGGGGVRHKKKCWIRQSVMLKNLRKFRKELDI